MLKNNVRQKVHLEHGTLKDIKNEENWRSLQRKDMLKINITRNSHSEQQGTLKMKTIDRV